MRKLLLIEYLTLLVQILLVCKHPASLKLILLSLDRVFLIKEKQAAL